MKTVLLILAIEFCLIITVIICMKQVIVSRKRLDGLLVKIPHQGYVLGNVDKTAWSKQKFMKFCAIPYAEPPSGPLRFKAPIRKNPWPRYIDATEIGRSCPAPQSIRKPTDKGDIEDCLNLCVYTKKLNALQPVILYIYGGGFNNGTALDYPPNLLLEKNIVLVVPHFRVGLLGWAFAYSKDIPGNMALLDLQFALKWIHCNIALFGGDQTKVTIMGQSGGACMAGALMLSTKAESRYFQRLIIMSGSVLSPWAINEHPRAQLDRICIKLRCEACQKYDKLLFCLKNSNVSDILEATKNEFFSPVVGDIHGVLPKQPVELLKYMKRPIPMLTGFTKHDGSFAVAMYYDYLKSEHCNFSQFTVEEFAKGMLSIISGPVDIPSDILERLFTYDLLRSTNHKFAIPEYIDLAGTVFIKSPVLNFAIQSMRKNLASIYLYTFEYQGQNTRYGYGFPTYHYPFDGGIHHSDENLYLFQTKPLNEDDKRVAKKMIEMWTSFAATGIPSHKNGPKILPIKDENGPYFAINKETTVKYNVIQEFSVASNDPNRITLIQKNRTF